MKYQINKWRITAIAGATALAITAQAQVVSYNFDNNGTIGSTSGYEGTQVGGAYPAVGWINDWDAYPTTDLWDNNNNNTGMDLAWSYNSGTWPAAGFSHPGQDANGTYNNEMLTGYANGIGAGSVSITLSQIPYALYDVYVYVMSDDDSRVGLVTDGATTYYFGANPTSIVPGGNAVFNLATATDASGFNTDANYAVFSSLAGDSQTFSTTFFSADGITDNYGGISAFQVVAVPEPGSLALAAVGLLLVGGRWRRLV